MAKAKDSGKPVIIYVRDTAIIGGEGARAIVQAAENVGTDYYRHTTEIVSYDSDTGVFETLNSRYVPESVVE